MEIEERIALGEEAKQFLNSPLGKYIQEKAYVLVDGAKEELAVVDPTDARKIAELQNVIARFDKFSEWLNGVILEGDNAYEIYQSEGE